MIKHNKILLLIGESAVGKDTILREILKEKRENIALKKAVSVTTRPKRKGEIEGVDYYFISDEEFNKAVNDNEFIERTCYYVGEKIWRYGFKKEEFMQDTNFIIVANPYGYRTFLSAYECEILDKEIVPIYLICNKKERQKRYFARDISNKNIKSEWEARCVQDARDFNEEFYPELEKSKEFHVFNTGRQEPKEIARKILGLL